MGFKYFNHPLTMSNSEVDRLNRVLDGASFGRSRIVLDPLDHPDIQDDLERLLGEKEFKKFMAERKKGKG